MGSNIEEAVRAKAFAEKQFVEKNFAGAKNYALKAQMLCPELEGISQMVATFGVYMASEAKINGEPDFYSILGLDPSVDKSKLKKQYKKMAVLLHPDKNKTVGADGAFRLVSEAWTLLSDAAKRSSVDTFWTVCTSCHVQYEYLRKYVNKRLSCKNCRGVFIAVETGLAPVNGSFPYSNYSYVPENGYGGHGCGITYVPTTTGYCPPSGSSGHHTGYRSEYVSNISFQGNSSGNSSGVLDPNGLSASSFVFYQSNGEANKTQANGNNHSVKATGHVGSNGYTGQNEVSKPRRGRPAKKRKVELGSSYASGHEELSQNIVVEPKIANGNGTLTPASKLPSPSETLTRRGSAAPTLDGRQLLIDKARSEIHRKLEEMRLAMEAAAAEAEKSAASVSKQPELKRNISMSITVPDSDFHDFDKDRSEECFKPKQIWALYDEEDGMPRLYCLIRDVISVKPFKVYISYLSSRSDSEFGSVNWLDCGFTKSCGSFRVFHSETVEQVNIFSHLLSREKAGRGGCVRIYPRSGDIWAVYRNWSPDWNRTTPDEVRHQYEMVEILHDYSEESGVWVAPLIKLDGFKTVPKEHRQGCHSVDSKKRDATIFTPAATPEELLQGETELQNSTSVVRTKKTSETPEKQHLPEPRGQSEKKSIQSEICSSTPKKVAYGACMEDKTDLELPLGEERIPPEVRQEETGMKATAEFPITETSQCDAEFR
ncbi:UNVERIFIED_CONTAM: Chaperone protein DnaJ [Sesamum latifolium]|uniref:Chaperone protein DnaJ n=1 Tax=Sesamum latifolium TaxID=2727402 RepID=A0AAW2WY30_9LAMI